MRSINSIVPIILAAGDSMRMGYPKALLPFGGGRFITHILGTLRNLGFSQPVIILGRAAPIIRPLIQGWQADVRINTDPDRGQLSSIQLGIMNVGPQYDAGMIWPVDQPAVSEGLVLRLIQLFSESDALIACPECNGRRGHPAIFHRTLFQEFMETPLDGGAQNILRRHQKDIAMLPTEEKSAIHDIDTPADYLSLTGENLMSALARTDAAGNS